MSWKSWKPAVDQPKLELETSAYELTLQIVGAVAITLGVLAVIYYWGRLPERIPIHFDLSGRPDGWGGRGWLIFLPLLSIVMWGALIWAVRIPHRYNYLWPITEENARRQYRLARELLAALGATIAVMFNLLALEQSRIATGQGSLLGPWWAALLLGVLLFLLVRYFTAAYRAR